MTCFAVSTTVGTRDDALRLARAMVEARIAACAQIATIESVYTWQGRVQHEPEWRLVLKTTEALREAAIAALAAQHPYEVPEIHAEALEHVHAPYADWVAANVGAPPS